MDGPDRCCVTACSRNAAASVTRSDLPGSLRLCATHTEQFRQSSEGWAIAWAVGEPAPTSVTAPGNEVLWAYRPSGGTSPDDAPVERPGRWTLPSWASRSRRH